MLCSSQDNLSRHHFVYSRGNISGFFLPLLSNPNAMIKIPLISTGKRRALLPLCLFLLSANADVKAQQQTIAAPAGSGAFGTAVVVLSNGNYVVTDPLFDDGAVTDVGAVYLYDGSTQTLISTLKGNVAGSQVGNGGITTLTNGNFVVSSPGWGDGVSTRLGAVTFVNGTSGLNGVVSNINSLVGSTTNDSLGRPISVVRINNDNYAVFSSRWDNGIAANAGAITWADGTTGISGTINASNSLVGSTANDQVGGGLGGSPVITMLSNGNYVISIPNWDNGAIADAGAATWINAATPLTGTISSSNSLVGGIANDRVASGTYSVTALTNGNYVVSSPNWDNGSIANVGAATWGNGATGTTGTINSSNSLIGSSANDQVCIFGAHALPNGNYVVRSATWKNGTASLAGAVTWCNGNGSTVGVVSSSNSIVGSTSNDQVGGGQLIILSNSNYIIGTVTWQNAAMPFAGALTWCSGNGGVPTGPITSSNSLVGGTAGDQLGAGSFTELTNGNYVVVSPYWSNGALSSAGAVTWCNGTTGISGTINSSNSLIGSKAYDMVGYGDASPNKVTALNNGNYVVCSPGWDNGATINVGAVTWANGSTGITGTISSSNSLIGTKAEDSVGRSLGLIPAVTALPNSNYVVISSRWDNGVTLNVGAVTLCNGATGTSGTINSTNSLLGSSTNDRIGSNGVLALSNSNYVVASPAWNNGTVTGAGAVTWGNGTTGTTGTVNCSNSLVGTSAAENMGGITPVALSNGNYVTGASNWDNGTNLNVGARIMGNASSPLTGTVNGCNSVTGTTGTGTSMDQVFNNVYNYALVKNSTANSVVVYYGPITTDPTLAIHLDRSVGMICAGTASFITSGGCRTIGKVAPNGAVPVTGLVNARVWIESSVPVYSAQPYVARHYEVAPTTNPTTATGKVTLYFTQQEFTDFNAHSGSALDLPTGPGDATGIANLRIGKYIGTTNNNTGLPDSYSNNASVIDPADADIVWNATKNWWEVSFDMTGSGGLIVQTFNTPLPLDLLEFSGKLQNDDALLKWKTENETHTAGFDVERSADGKSFAGIGMVQSANRPETNYYAYTDLNISSLSINEVYYRLKQKDTDGRYKYSQVIRLSLEGKNTVTLYPNPTNSKVALSISLAAADNLQFRILDNIGRVVQQQQASLSTGTTIMSLDVNSLAPGVYYLELRGNIFNERKRFVKQ
jgi:hypothetical protein